MAEGLEPLHVDGRYLKNSRGDIVTLHGYMAVLDPWFQAEEYTWEGFDVATCLKNKKAAIFLLRNVLYFIFAPVLDG